MELKEAIKKLKLIKWQYEKIPQHTTSETFFEERQAIDTVLEELDNRISKDELKNVLRRVQDYQLNYKDTVLFNIIMQDIFGETEWTNLEDKE